jgi:hypothetical protein
VNASKILGTALLVVGVVVLAVGLSAHFGAAGSTATTASQTNSSIMPLSQSTSIALIGVVVALIGLYLLATTRAR